MEIKEIRKFLARNRKIVKGAEEVFVEVNGPHDIFWAKVSKREASLLLEDSDGQLEVRITSVDGTVVIGANYSFDD